MTDPKSAEKSTPVDKSGHSPMTWFADDDGWICDHLGSNVVEYAGCGSHKAQWRSVEDYALAIAAPDLLAALRIAEAALADIGDSEGDPAPTAEWCEGRAYRVLATIRAALSRARGEA